MVWLFGGDANTSDVDKIKNLQKRVIYAISESFDDTSINHLLFNLKILNIDDLFKLCSLMWDYDHGTIPSSPKDLFTRSHIVSKHGTRGATSGNLYHNKVYEINFF